QGMYTNFIAGIYIKEHNKVLPFVTGVGAAVNIITNILLIPILGIMGAALATLFAYMAMAITLYWQSQKVYPISYDWRRVGMLAIVVLAGFGIDRYISLTLSLSIATLLSIRAAIVIAVLGALVLFGFFSRSELAAIKE